MEEFDPTKHLKTQREDVDGIAVFHLVGDCDMHTTPYVRLEISPVLSMGQPAVIDLTQVAFMDSAGYGMLVGLAKVAADNNAKFSVAVKSPGIVLTGLRVLQVDHVLHVALNVEDAIKLIRS